MSRLFEDGIAGATFGGLIGGALGTIFAGVTLALPGINIVVAPLLAAAATTVTVSGAAAGTVVGGTACAVHGAVKDSKEKRSK